MTWSVNAPSGPRPVRAGGRRRRSGLAAKSTRRTGQFGGRGSPDWGRRRANGTLLGQRLQALDLLAEHGPTSRRAASSSIRYLKAASYIGAMRMAPAYGVGPTGPAAAPDVLRHGAERRGDRRASVRRVAPACRVRSSLPRRRRARRSRRTPRSHRHAWAARTRMRCWRRGSRRSPATAPLRSRSRAPRTRAHVLSGSSGRASFPGSTPLPHAVT